MKKWIGLGMALTPISAIVGLTIYKQGWDGVLMWACAITGAALVAVGVKWFVED